MYIADAPSILVVSVYVRHALISHFLAENKNSFIGEID